MHETVQVARTPRFGRTRRRRRLAVIATSLVTAAVPAMLATTIAKPADAAIATTPIGVTAVSGWKLDMSDDFNTLNTARWSIKNNTWNKNEQSYLLARNVSVGSGIVRVQGKKESVGGRSYTSGYLDTRNKYTLPNHFRVEIRAKVPLEMGMWAAPMWFRPADSSGGEIDLLETYGADMQKFGEYRAHHTIHNAYGSGHQTNQKQAVIPGDPLAWHTYTIEKSQGKTLMYVDGVQKGQWLQGDPSWYNTYFESGKRWAMIMNLQIGGPRGSPTSSTNWTGDKTAMQVDYVRAWVKG